MKLFLIPFALALGGQIAAEAASFSAAFNDGQPPPNTAVHGSAVVESAGGVDDSGVLKLTKAVNGQQGGFIIEDFDGFALVYGFSADFKVRVGGGTSTPADGFSFCWAEDLPDGPFGEEGTGSGLTITFDTYDNGGGEAPAIDVKFDGVTLASTPRSIPEITTGSAFEDVSVALKPTGLLDLSYKGEPIYTDLPIPGFLSMSGARFGFGARTGGLNANQFVDDLTITTELQPAVGLVQQPQSRTVLAGSSVTFQVAVNNPDGVSYQWFKNGAAIPGATSENYVVPNAAVADDGSVFTAEARAPGETLTSDEAVLNVVQIDAPTSPDVRFDFNDGFFPLGTALYGSALVDFFGGVDGSGVLILTQAINDESGSFIIEDLDAGNPVFGFTAAFQMLVFEGTVPPADGFSFSFADNLPDDTFPEAENGAGTGLVVAFDIYDNGGGEAPSVDVRFGGEVLASTPVPLSLLETGADFVSVIIHLENDGTLDVAYDGVVIYHDFPLSSFTSIQGGRFALAARTGGLNADQWVDNFELTTVLVPGTQRITRQPESTSALLGRSATFSVSVGNEEVASYQWFKDGAPIAGATSAAYTTPPTVAADDGSVFHVTVGGQNGATLTSDSAVLGVLDLSAPANPTLALDFNSGATPPNSALFGTAKIFADGGIGNSGVLSLTEAVNSESGAFIVNSIEGGAELAEVVAAFQLRAGGGTEVPADGFSFNLASDLPQGTIGEAENGAGTGLTIAFDTYNNGGGEGPSIDIRYGGDVVASKILPRPFLETGDDFVQVLIALHADGTVDVVFNEEVVFHGVPLPDFEPISGAMAGWAARTGGLNANHWIDDIAIAAARAVGPLRITEQPRSITLLAGRTATFSVGVSDPNGASYQWSRDGAEIGGATDASFTTGPLQSSDHGARYSVRVTGPGGTVNSADAVVTVVTPIVASNPKLNANFNDGFAPLGTDYFGDAFVDFFDGVNGSGVLKLTVAENGLQGSFFVYDLDLGEPVSGFTATFKARVGGGTVPPADGFSFVWANDLADGSTFGEEGSGSGLVVSFDTYVNPAETSPAFSVRYAGEDVASTDVPIDRIQTGDDYVDAAIRVESDGTFDLLYDGELVYYNLPLPGFKPIAGGTFAFGGRTGGLNDNHWIDDLAIATDTSAPPAVSDFTGIRLSQGNVVIEWAGAGTLQSGPSVQGPWTNVPNASSPHTVSPSEPLQFYRLTSQP